MMQQQLRNAKRTARELEVIQLREYFAQLTMHSFTFQRRRRARYQQTTWLK